ncbi:MAG: aquaporin family protein [Verrucomicrobia bacterium]|nr:aquaporin family protein [Verrucomicrobiota bacterium]
MNAYIAELLGTMILLLFGGGTCAAASLKGTYSNGGGWLMISAGWGLAVGIAVYAVGNYSGAHINPAVTLGLAVAGEFEWAKVPGYIAAQMAGAFIGAVLVFFQYLPHWKATDDAGTKLGVFSTGPAIANTSANLVSEMIGTFILVLGLMSIGANQFAEGLNPLIVGLLIVVIGIALGGTTGYAINPARDLAPRLAHALLPIYGKGSSNWSYAWIPVVGPVIGGVYGALFYKAVFLASPNMAFWAMSAVVAVIMAWALLKRNS